MTTTTTAKTAVKAPRKPTRLERKIAAKKAHLARVAAPYVGVAGAGAIAGLATGSLLPTVAAASMSAAIAADRIREARDWHRNGGKAAMRKRRKYQGWATRRDIHRLRRLGPGPADSLLVLGRARGTAVAVHRENSVLYIGPPGYGKALALDTPVPTPDGWTTMGALQDGDLIFGTDGLPHRIVRAWPVRYERPCYEVVFSDGSVITADADHLWFVNTRASRMSESGQRKERGKRRTPSKSKQHLRQMPQVLTTAMMAGSVRVGSDNRANYSVTLASPLDLPDADLPVPPYTLGAWLGDGRSADGRIWSMDPEIIKEIEAEGETCDLDLSPSAQGKCPNYRIIGLTSRLRILGVLGNKHIPVAYLRASEPQRRALLAGLLDTDGHCLKNANLIEFLVTNERLARDVRHLIASLGYKTTLRSKAARLYGKDCGTAWTVTASPADGVFRLPRKLERQNTSRKGSAATRAAQLYIEEIRPVPSVPVRCITVDSPDHLYLVGDTCIPTHNTAALACHAADAPGALFATSTKTELLLDTVLDRMPAGRIWILNADGYGNIPGTLSWSPLDGCRNPQTAQRRAGDFAKASPKSGKTDADYWTGMGAGLIAVMLHAAAVTGATMREVTAWVRNPWADEIREAYKRPDADPMLATKLASLTGGEGEHLNGIIGAAEAALAWMDDPVMAAVACPAPGEGFSPREFACSTDSVYLIGRKRPFGSLAPYFAVLGSEVFEQLKRHAMETPAGRLPAPATFVLDEMPLTCPMPVHDMLAEARGYMITIAAGAQSLSQLRSVWGKDDGDTIRSASPVEVIFGGEKRHEDLEALSAVIGSRDTWHHVKHADGSKTRQPDKERLMPPEALHRLAKRKAVILAPACRPVLADLPAIWERPGYERADLSARAPVPQPQLALEAAPRAAIPMPAGTPVPVISDSGTAEPPVIIPDTAQEVIEWQPAARNG